MGRYATRAEQLDELLRGERFVDLYAVVRQALRAGVESYSIKKLEQFYGFARALPLHDAAVHLQAIELALEGQRAWRPFPTKRVPRSRRTTQDDCRSTEALRDWLERLRAELEAQGTAVPRPTPKAGEANEKVGELERRQQAARRGCSRASPSKPPARITSSIRAGSSRICWTGTAARTSRRGGSTTGSVICRKQTCSTSRRRLPASSTSRA